MSSSPRLAGSTGRDREILPPSAAGGDGTDSKGDDVSPEGGDRAGAGARGARSGSDGSESDVSGDGAGAGAGVRAMPDLGAMEGPTKQLKQRIVELGEENKALKNWASRLEIELHRYQARDPKLPEVTTGPDGDLTDIVSPPWLDSPDTLPPLVKAYDMRVAELEAELDKQRDTFAEATDNVVRMEAEITDLHAQLDDATKRLLKSAESNPASAAVAFSGGDALLEQRAELEEQLELALKECGLLQDQVAALTEENTVTARKIGERDQRLAHITQRYQQAVAAVAKLQDDGKRVLLDKQTCETRLLQLTAQLAESRRASEKMVAELKKEKDRNSRQAAQIEDQKVALLELRAQMDGDKDELDDQIRTASANSRRLQQVVDRQADELDRYKSELGAVTREHDEIKRDAENMLQVMQSYEKQLHEYAAREASWDQLEKQSVEKVEEALLERDQAQAKETQSRREIARLLERRKVEAAEALRQRNSALAALRTRFEAQLSDRDNQLKELSMRCTELQALADRCARDRQTAEREVERVMEAASKEHGSLNAEVEAMVDRMRSVEAERDSLAVSLRESQGEAAEAHRHWGIQRQAFEEQLSEAARRVDESAAELEEAKGALRANGVAASDLETQIRDMKQQHAKNMARVTQQLEQASAEKRTIKEEAGQSVHEMQMALQESTDRIAQLQAAQESARLAYRDEAKSTNERFTRALQDLTDDRNRLASRNEELLAQLTAVSSQREELVVARQELDNKLQIMHGRVVDAEKRATSGAAQLAQAFGEQERRLKELQTVRASVDRAQLAEARSLRRQRHAETRLMELQQQYEQLQLYTGGGAAPRTSTTTTTAAAASTRYLTDGPAPGAGAGGMGGMGPRGADPLALATPAK